MPRTLTDKELLDLWQRRRLGTRTEDLAAELSIQGQTLRKHWRNRLGVSPELLSYSERRTAYTPEHVYHLRSAGMTYGEICVLLRLEFCQRNVNRLSMSLKRYCKRLDIPSP